MALLRAQFRAFVANQLRMANTDAGQSVFEWKALPTKPTDWPAMVLWTPHEVKTSRGRGAPKFTTDIHLMIQARVTGVTDEQTAIALDRLAEQIEMATLGNSAVVNLCQQFVTVETVSTVSLEGGKPIGELTMTLTAEIPQVYDPAMPDCLTEIDVYGDRAMKADPLAKIVTA